jgi:hypothetical protein
MDTHARATALARLFEPLRGFFGFACLAQAGRIIPVLVGSDFIAAFSARN